MVKKRQGSIKNRSPNLCVALYDYDPVINELDHNPNTPEITSQLIFKRGEILRIVSDVLDHWILCKSSVTNKQGYVLSSLLAPLSGAVDSAVCYNKRGKLAKRSRLQHDDMVYFPNFPFSKPKPECPALKANFLSLLFFEWVTRFLIKGFKRPLNDDDIWKLQKQNTSSYVSKKFQVCWDDEIKKYKKSSLKEKVLKGVKISINAQKPEIEALKISSYNYKPSILKALLKTCGKNYLIATPLLKLIYDSSLFIQPWLLGKSIQVIKNKNIGSHWGYLYASLFFVSGLLGSIILHQYIQIAFVTSLRTRSCLLTAIYRKIFVLCNFDRDDFAVGEIINLMTVDTQKCYDLLPSFNMVWSAPFQIIVALIYLYLLMGWSVLAGFGILILFVPITCCFSVYEMKFQVKQMVFKDSRYKLINEIVAGINVLKLYSWENSFIAKVMNFRNDEVKLIKKAMFLQATHSFVLTLVPILVSLSTFTVYVLLGNNLDAEKAFVAVSLFNIMKFPLFSLPLVIANIAQYNVSAKRLSKFLKSDELNPVSVSNDKNITSAVEIHNGTFKWNIQNEPILNNVNLKIPCGSLTAVVGQVGSGKSSLISAILGEIKRVGGDVFVKGSISYVSQQPWIQNKSLRDNILFVSKYKALKYNKIIDACALRADISTLVDEDRTEIGENGINLSGGQKQRISIARAVYHNSDIYIMDDSLSAVDAHVGKHIFDQVIGKKGLLNNKTRLFVTNDLTYLPYVDQIIVLSENKILKCGSYEELINNSANADFYKDLYHGVYNRDQVERTNTVENNESVKDLKVNFEVVRKFTSPISKISHYVLAFTNCALAAFSFDECLKVLQKMKLNINMGNYYDLEKNELYQREASEILKRREKIDFLKDSNRTKVLISDEIFTTGKVNQSVYWTYARCVGILITMIFLCFGLITEGFSLSSRVWLAEWSSDKNVLEKTRNMYLGIYGALGIGQGLSSWLQAYIICFGVTNASKALHYNLLTNVLRCPMIFFETTPMGRIVNRFSKDINLIDESIPKSLKSFVSCLLTLLSTIAIISYTTPIFLAIFFLIGVVYILIQVRYIKTTHR